MEYVREAKDLVRKKAEAEAQDKKLREDLVQPTRELSEANAQLSDLKDKLRLCYETLDVLKTIADPEEMQSEPLQAEVIEDGD